jgi:K+-transporting ATPase KdpF subunit
MTGVESIVGLALSALAAAYLVYALVFPEKL